MSDVDQIGITRLDNDYAAFFEAQDSFRTNPDATALLEVRPKNQRQLAETIDPMRLQHRLDRLAELRLDPAQRQYLAKTGQFDAAFLDCLDSGDPATPRVVRAKNNELKITVSGPATDVLLWSTLVQAQVRDIYYSTIASAQQLNEDALIGEGIRRFQVKADMIRHSGLRFIEAGTRYRPSFQWYHLILTLLIGDIGDHIDGTTNLQSAMMTGLRPVANVGARRVQEPSIREVDRLLEEDASPVVVTECNAFAMAHLYGHFGDLLRFEWDRDLMGDMGPFGGFLPLQTRTTIDVRDSELQTTGK